MGTRMLIFIQICMVKVSGYARLHNQKPSEVSGYAILPACLCVRMVSIYQSKL